MNSNTKFAVLFSLVLVVIISCSPALYLPTLADSQNAGAPLEALTRGRNLYVTNCENCHYLYKPQHFTRNEWRKVMPDMQKRAEINDQDKTLIINYLLARSKDFQLQVH